MNYINENIELGLHQSAENSTSYWIKTSTFERLWKADPNGSFLDPDCCRAPKSKYFSLHHDADQLLYILPCVQILVRQNGNAVYVQNGRDRARWLIDSGIEEIPVAIYCDIGIEKAGTGIILRRVQPNDVIRVKNNFDCERIIAKKTCAAGIQGNGIFDGLFQPHRVGNVVSGY